MNIEEKIIDVMKGMEGIGGVPTPEGYYAEFDMRVKAALGLVDSDCISHVSGLYVLYLPFNKAERDSRVYLSNNVWEENKDLAEKYTWKEALKLSSKMHCGFTDA